MATFLNDTFTDSPAKDLTAHTGETGATWAEHPSYTAGNWQVSGGIARGQSVQALDYASGAPAGADYYVEGELVMTGTPASMTQGIAGRIDTTDNTYYTLLHDTNNDAWTLRKRVGGGSLITLATWGETIASGSSRTCKLEMVGDQIAGYIDGTLRLGPVTDTDIAAAGKAGLYALSGTGSGITFTSITAADIATAATHLAFDEQPSETPANVVITPAITVFALDDNDQIDSDFTDDVTIAIQTGSGILGGTLTVGAVNGVATFPDLEINTAQTGVVLRATATGLTLADSDPFDILSQLATHLAFVQHPTTVVENTAIAPAITVEALKADEARDTAFTGEITLAIGTNPGGGSLGGTVTVNAVAGLATFSSVNVSNPGVNYTLLATGPGMTGANGATSIAFTVTLSPATHLFFQVQPSEVDVNSQIIPPVVVYARNAENVLDTNFQGDIEIAMNDNPTGATLGGSTTVTAEDGVATFSDLTIDKPGEGYTLIASEA